MSYSFEELQNVVVEYQNDYIANPPGFYIGSNNIVGQPLILTTGWTSTYSTPLNYPMSSASSHGFTTNNPVATWTSTTMPITNYFGLQVLCWDKESIKTKTDEAIEYIRFLREKRDRLKDIIG